jgi:hypothetical protein
MAQNWVIPANTTETVTAPLDKTVFDLLWMGSGSTLRILVDTRIQVIDAHFEDGCKITGSAPASAAPKPPTPNPYAGVAGQCDSGLSGTPGRWGEAGQRGRNISMEIGLSSIGSLLVESNGQPGGDGGDGGEGQGGGGAKCVLCRGGGGGPGGPGGGGGSGGDGGTIVFSWSPIKELATKIGALDADVQEAFNANTFALANLTLVAEPGNGGRGGLGGGGGRGGDSVNCGLFGQTGGDPGGHGADGARGVVGRRIKPVQIKT